MEYIEARSSQLVQEEVTPAFAWVILLPVFFIAGWFCNGFIHRQVATVAQYPQVGVGGGPEDINSSTQLKIYQIAPDTSLPANVSPAPENHDKKVHEFNGSSAIEQI